MKKVLTLVACLILCLALAGCGANNANKQEEKASTSTSDASATKDSNHIKVGLYGGTCEMALMTALTGGFFEDEGLTYEVVKIGYSDIATLMASDELDLYLSTPTDIMGMKSGLPIYFTDSMHTGCFEGVATPESGITSVADLEGKTLAVDMIGSVAYVQICSEMTRLGYDHTKVNWKVYDPSTMLAAAQAGEVDGFCQGDQLCAMAVRDNGMVYFFSDTRDEYLKDTLCCFIGMDTDIVDNNPETAKAVSRAIQKTCQYIEGHEKESVAAAIEAGYLVHDDPDLCTELVKGYTWLAGDETRYYESFKEHLRENYRAGLLDDAPADEAARESYYDTFIEEHGRFCG